MKHLSSHKKLWDERCKAAGVERRLERLTDKASLDNVQQEPFKRSRFIDYLIRWIVTDDQV